MVRTAVNVVLLPNSINVVLVAAVVATLVLGWLSTVTTHVAHRITVQVVRDSLRIIQPLQHQVFIHIIPSLQPRHHHHMRPIHGHIPLPPHHASPPYKAELLPLAVASPSPIVTIATKDSSDSRIIVAIYISLLFVFFFLFVS